MQGTAYPDSKRCPRCGLTKDVEQHFGWRKAGSGNRVARSVCRDCARNIARERYYANRERIIEAGARRRREDPERFAEYNRRWRERHRDARAAAIRQWRIENRERILQYARDWRKANAARRAELQGAYMRRFRKRDPERYRALINERARKRRGAARGRAIPFTLEALAERLSMWPGCWVCGGRATEVDHVKPLAKGGAHMLCNLRPICRSCNARKSDRWPFDATT